MTDDFVRYGSGFDYTRPADHAWHAKCAFPIGILLVAKGRYPSVGPGVHVRTVVGAVHDDGVVGDAEVIELFEEFADDLIVLDHYVMIFGLPATRLANDFGFGVSAEVHMGGVEPNEEGHVRFDLALDKSLSFSDDLVVDRPHPFFAQRTCVDNRLSTVGIGLAVKYTARG